MSWLSSLHHRSLAIFPTALALNSYDFFMMMMTMMMLIVIMIMTYYLDPNLIKLCTHRKYDLRIAQVNFGENWTKINFKMTKTKKLKTLPVVPIHDRDAISLAVVDVVGEITANSSPQQRRDSTHWGHVVLVHIIQHLHCGVNTYMCMCVCTHTHTHTHIYIYIYIYTHTHTHTTHTHTHHTHAENYVCVCVQSSYILKYL